jgi:para-aminobenzoate synthetase component 1
MDMMKFVDLPQKLSWKSILPKIEPKVACMLLKDEENFMIGWGERDVFEANDKDFKLSDYQAFREKNAKNYTLGYFGYDLKNVIEPKLSSANSDHLQFPDTFWFVPQHLVISIGGKLIYSSDRPLENHFTKIDSPIKHSIDLSPLTPKDKYLEHIEKILAHIQRGDIYEVNYCVNFEGKGEIDPVHTFMHLHEKAQAPFSSFMAIDGKYILSASPERFLLKEGGKLISQPIKGTAARSEDPLKDKELADQLQQDKKERSENVMIVDLVRNDLSKLAKKSSVQVPELFKIYSFNTVHQMISTVQCLVKEGTSDSEILKALFPMGSMTGAPKFSAMSIAEEQEAFKRGVYSGAIGVFHPNGNFDLNVVIRSILYNSKDNVVSAAVGSAITIKSDPLSEYNECLIKLEALQKALC